MGNTTIEVGIYGYDEAANDYRIAIIRRLHRDTIFFDRFGGRSAG